jgi:redox-sensitive bicupin YhaK (pirin superfamily)
MIRYIDSEKMGRSKLGWLDSYFHFSFAEYYHPDNVQFGALRVINDDRVQPGAGFDTHPHKNMEIISYVVEGELTHADSMSNEETLTRGQVQYMSAGTGVTHSEYNNGKSLLRFLQIWIFPDKNGYKPNYGSHRFEWEERRNKWLHIATAYGAENEAPIRVHADINAYAAEIEAGRELSIETGSGRQAYMVLIEGSAHAGTIPMKARDALEIIGESVTVRAEETSHAVVIEMAKA